MSTLNTTLPAALILLLVMAAGGAAAANAQSSIALAGDRVFPQNIAASRDGAIYVGSVGVYRIEPHGSEAKVWIKPGSLPDTH